MSSLNPTPMPRVSAHTPGLFRRGWSSFLHFITTSLVKWLFNGFTLSLFVTLVLGSIYLYIDRSNLTRDRDDLRESMARLARQIDQSERDLIALRDNYHAATSARAALEQSNADSNLRITQFQQQYQTLVTANSTLAATKVTLENAKSIATKQVQQLQQQLASLTQANRDLTDSNADLNQLRSQSNTKLQLLEKENKDLNAALKEWRIKAETPIDRPIPLAVQTSGTFAFPTELSWGGGDIFLSAPAVTYFSTRSVNLTSKVGDDTTTHKIYLEEPLLKKPIIIKGLRGDLTLDVLKVSFTKAGALNLFYTPATLQFKASYRPVTVAPETPPAK